MKRPYLGLVSAAVMLVIGATALFANAAEFVTVGNHRAVSVPSNEIHHNLYVAGGTVNVSGTTTGDLYAAGGVITVNGSVQTDSVLAGGTITSNGPVGANLRVAGGSVTINSPVNGDLVVAGGTIEISDTAVVKGDLVVAGGTVYVNGAVTGNVTVVGGTVTLNSAVGGKVDIKASKGVVFDSKADIAGAITVAAPNQPQVNSGAKASNIAYTKFEPRRMNGLLLFGLGTGIALLIQLLAYILTAWILAYFMPRRGGSAVNMMYAHPWSSFGIGLLTLVATPIIGVILFFTFIGYYLSFMLFAWFFLMLLVASILGALFVGAWIMKMYNRTPGLMVNWQAALVGGIVYVLVGAIPVVGWILRLIVWLIALGTLVYMASAEVKADRTVATNELPQ